jgi:hypothetical protein
MAGLDVRSDSKVGKQVASKVMMCLRGSAYRTTAVRIGMLLLTRRETLASPVGCKIVAFKKGAKHRLTVVLSAVAKSERYYLDTHLSCTRKWCRGVWSRGLQRPILFNAPSGRHLSNHYPMIPT